MPVEIIFKSIIICTIYSIACLSLGAFILKIMGLFTKNNWDDSSAAYLITAFLLGSGILASIWSLILSASCFYQWVVIVIILFSISLGTPVIWRNHPLIKKHIKTIWKDFIKESWPWKVIILLTLLIVLQTGVICFLPLKPNGDAAAFYMVLPKLLAETNKLSLLGGYEAFTTIGLHGEFHFAALMALGSEWGAKLFTLPIGLACAMMLAAIAGRCGVRRRGQWLVLTMAFTSTAFILLIGDGKVDMFGAAMGCAAFYWVLQKGVYSEKKTHFLAGFFVGFAVIAKISYLPILIPSIFLFILWNHILTAEGKVFSQSNLKVIAIKYCWLIIGIALPVLIHFIKNWVLFREPLAPFIYFQENPFGENWANQAWFSPEITRKIILTYPLALIYGQYPMQYGTMSIMLLAFAPLFIIIHIFKQLRQSNMFQITLLGILGIVIWMIIRPSVFAPRYILYTLLLLIPFVAGCVEHVLKYESKPRWLSAAIISACLFYLVVYNGMLANKVAEWNLEAKNSNSTIRSSEKLNSMAKTGDRILSLNHFTYWYRQDLLKNLSTADEQQYLKENKSISPYEAWTYVYNKGFEYIVINHSTHGYVVQVLAIDKIPEKFQVKEIFREQDYSIYKLIST